MSKVVHIFVEGDADVKFISDYISHIKLAEAKIHGLNGWTDIKNMRTDIARYKDENNDVLVIFDADTSKNKGGFVTRKKQIEDYALPLDDIFLFPDNQNDGALEDLLENIINNKNKPIFDCWERYETCLKECASKKIGKELTTPAKKSKIYGYLEVLVGETEKEKKKIKDPNRDYKKEEHWNLDAKYLNPLKEFLLKYLN